VGAASVEVILRIVRSGYEPSCLLSDFFTLAGTSDSTPTSVSVFYYSTANWELGSNARLDSMVIETHDIVPVADAPTVWSNRFVGERLLFPLSMDTPPVTLASAVSHKMFATEAQIILTYSIIFYCL
jgi:hypothetical protein